jgi:Tn3 transposase DDE domain
VKLLQGSAWESARPHVCRILGREATAASEVKPLTRRLDETYRRRILTQLNRGGGRHGVARTVLHGQRGEVRQRYGEGEEDQLGAMGLVVNVLVLWNTLYMDVALAHLRRTGAEVKPEDVARLSPLGHEHINVLGRYTFALAHGIAQGELRPLRHPEDGDDLTVGEA